MQEQILPDGTLGYLSPEMRRKMLGEEVEVNCFQSDIFSLGITMLHLAQLTLTSSIRWSLSDPEQLKQAVETETGKLSYSEDLLELLRGMLESDPVQRLTIEELFMHMVIDSRAEDVAKTQHQLDFSGMQTTICIFDVFMKWIECIESQGERDSYTLKLQLFTALIYDTNERFEEYKGILKQILLYHDDDIEVEEITLFKAMLWSDLCTKCYLHCNLTDAEEAHNKALKFSIKLHNSDNRYLSLLYRSLGFGYIHQGKLEEAERMHKQSLTAALQLSEESEAVAAALASLGNLYCMQQKYNLGEEACLRSVTMMTKLAGEHILIEQTYMLLSQIYMKQNKLSEWKECSVVLTNAARKRYKADSVELARYLGDLGVCYFDQERNGDAEALLEEAVRIYQSRRYINPEVIIAYICLGSIYNNENRLEEAEQLLEQAAKMYLKTSALTNNHLAYLYMEMGDVLRKRNKLEEAHTESLKALSILKAAQQEDLSKAYFNLVKVCFQLEKWPECEQYLTQMMEILKEQEAKLACAYVHKYLAEVSYKQGKVNEAETAIIKGIDTLKHLSQAHQELPRFYCLLATIYHYQKRLPDAEELFILAINEIKDQPGENNAYIFEAKLRLCQIYNLQGKYTESEKILKPTIDLMVKRPEGQHEYQSIAYQLLAETYFLQGDLSQSETVYSKFIELRLAEKPEDHLNHSYCYQQWAHLLLEQGNVLDAERAILKAVDTLVQHFGETHQELPGFYSLLAIIYTSQGRLPEAEALIDWIKSFSGEHCAFLIDASLSLLIAYKSNKNYDEAERVLTSTIGLIEKSPEFSKKYKPEAYFQLAHIYFLKEKLEESEVVYIECIDLLLKEKPEDYLEHSLLYKALALVLVKRGKLDEAEGAIMRGVEIQVEHFGQTDQELHMLYGILADIYYKQGRLPKSRAMYARLINEMNSQPDENYILLIETSLCVCEIYMKESNYPEAKKALKSVIGVIQIRPEESQKYLAQAYLHLGGVYLLQEKYQKAKPLLQTSLEMYIQLRGDIDISVASACYHLGCACTRLHQLEEGTKMLLRAIQIAKELPDGQQFLTLSNAELSLNREMQLSYRSNKNS